MSVQKYLKHLAPEFDHAKDEVVNAQVLTNDFATLISQICQKIHLLAGTEEQVHFEDNNLENFKLELASFLAELKCPYDKLIVGDQRLESLQDRLILLQYLTGEYLASKRNSQVESRIGASIQGILKALNIQNPPKEVSNEVLFNQICSKVNKNMILKPQFADLSFNRDQWNQLYKAAQDLEQEFALRRSMLITRFSATMDSFLWSERAKGQNQDVIGNFLADFDKNNLVKSHNAQIGVSDLLAARSDILEIQKVSSTPPESRIDNALTKIKVGRVPDRGGRPSEQAAPPPEMPSWQQRSGQPHSARGGGGGHRGGGGHGGGRHNKHRGVQGAGWKKN